MSQKILTYRELRTKDDLLPLMYLAFGWPFNYEEFEKTAQANPRLRDSPIGFCALKDGHVVGFVGVMDLITRNLKGEIERAGGIWGVSTLPSHSRQGISTMLMNEAHAYFRDRGYSFSFLITSRSLIAYNFYQKLGYQEATRFPSAFKHVKRGKTIEKEKAKENLEKILRIYRDCFVEKSGFVVRDEDYLKAAIGWEEAFHKVPEEAIFEDYAYVMFKDLGGSLCIDEIVAKNKDHAKDLITKIENGAKAIIYDRTVLDKSLLQLYESLGYTTQTSSYTALMVKPLQNYKSFRETYGDKFYMSSLDYF
jgi:GNAT superfamily N-acetyltransferase